MQFNPELFGAEVDGRTVIFMIKNSKNLRPERFRASLGGVWYPPWGRCWRGVRAAGHASVVRTDHICVENAVFYIVFVHFEVVSNGVSG